MMVKSIEMVMHVDLGNSLGLAGLGKGSVR